MKNTKTASRLLASVTAIFMCVLLMFLMSACTETPADSDPTVTSVNSVVSATADEYASVWADAAYTKNIRFGEGANSFYFEVVVGEHSVTFLINTDETVVGKALLAHGIIAGDEGDFGLYVKTVNGMFADYDVNSAYWAFYQDGEMMMTGVDMTDIEAGAHYEMVYTK